MKYLKNICVVLSAALLLTLAGCGKKAETEISVPDAVQAAFDAAGFSEELVQLDDSVVTGSYKTLDLSKVEAYEVYVSGSMGTPEELAVFKAKSSEDVKSVTDAVKRRVEDQTLAFEDYRPDEMPKLENAVTVQKGVYVLFAVCPNSDAVRGVFEEL